MSSQAASNIINTDDLVVLNNLQALPDWQMKYGYLIELGKQLISSNADIQQDENRLYGCQSSVWMTNAMEDDRIIYKGTSDSTIVAGLIALLMQVYSNRTAEQIVSTEPDFLEKTGLIHNITSQRATGLLSMIEQMKAVAQQQL